LKSYMRFI